MRFRGFSSLFLKIIGVLTMTVDHLARIGKYFEIAFFSPTVYALFTSIGRISFPIFAFLIVEGMLHSHDQKAYLLRLLLLSFFCDLLFFLVSGRYIGNPVTTLFLGAAGIYFLEKKEKWKKALVLIPTFLAISIALDWIPLSADYDLFGYTLIVLFYLAMPLSERIGLTMSQIYRIDAEAFLEKYGFSIRLITSCLLLIGLNLIVWLFNPCYRGVNIFIDDPLMQLNSIFAVFFLLIYNGKKGYTSKWVQYGMYFYFPIHLILIYLFFMII